MEQTPTVSKPLFSSHTLRLLIVPLIVEQLLAMTVGMADTVMLTTVSEAAVSGVSLVDTINNLIIQVLAALATGGAVVCSQYLGRQDDASARKAALQLLYTMLAFALAVSIILLSFRRSILGFIFGHIEADVLSSAMVYLLLTTLSFPFLAIYNSCAALFRSMGNSRVSLVASALMNVINIGGNAILIYGFNLGAEGAGIATLLSRATAALMMLMLIRSRRNPIYIDRVYPVVLDWNMIRSIFRVGVPSGVENGIFQFGKLLVQSLITRLGTAAIAANAILNSIAGLVIVPGSAVGLAMITVVGQCVGANDYQQAVSYTKKLLLTAYACLILTALPVLLLCDQVIGLFHLSAAATADALSVLPVQCIMHMLLWPAAFTLPNALRAAGDARFTMIISVCAMWVLRVGLSYVFILGLGMGVGGVWYAMYCDWMARIICFSIRFKRGRWKAKRVIF